MTDHDDEQRDDTITDNLDQEPDGQERREFLRSLGKWSQAVIGGVLVGGALTTSDQAQAWYNRGGSWYNRGGGGWGNRSGWYNGGGGGWGNRGGGGWG
ncbi:MAG: hypothetical protein WAV07_16255, partial [Candidatus Contendobacter sp.]